MHIAIISEVFLPKIDGVVLRTMNLIRRLKAKGDEIVVVCPMAGERGDCPVPILEFKSFPFLPYPEYRIGIPDQRLVKGLVDFQPDVVHFINPFAFGFRCFDLLQSARISYPYVFSFHTLYGEFAKQYGLLKPLSQMLWWLMRDYHNRAHTNLTVSEAMRHELIQRGFERVELWPPAVDSQIFRPQPIDTEMRTRLSDGHPEKPLLVTVSRLAPEKSIDRLADVLRQTPYARLAIIGDGPQRAELERRFAGLPAKFLGYMKGAELARAYAAADAFVYASETETMGNVVLEAMACGLSVVAPRAGGIPSLVVDEQEGLLYAPGNLRDAAQKVQQLIAGPDYRAKLGAAAHARASQCTWDSAADSVRNCYERTIAAQATLNSRRFKHSRLSTAVLASLVTGFRAAHALGSK